MRIFILALSVSLMALSAQSPVVPKPDDPEANIPDEEKRIPPGHYCKRPDVEIRPTETMAHHCDCIYTCSIDEDGAAHDNESSNCLAWCQKNGRRCSCYPEGDPLHPCEGQPKGMAWKDMNGNLVAVHR
jgi:hypothetical protein